ncbi:ATP-binding cassette domain-containing protein, partial [Myxococcota bacterium]|nr:ATP-binding cassette domain-containing protein [Myxococcota bacterium]
TLLGAHLHGVTFILDEPTLGLHAKDTKRLMKALSRLQAEGNNTLIIVEHDREVIQSADHIIDMGPQAGEAGGRVVAQGTLEEIRAHDDSPTGCWLRESSTLPSRSSKNSNQSSDAKSFIKINKASKFNLSLLNIMIPLGKIVSLTGVSGSGKTTLAMEVLAQSIKSGRAVGCESIEGTENIGQLIAVNQEPLGKSPLSIPLTVLGLSDEVRNIFAKTDDAKIKGLSKKHFTQAGPAGRCPRCKGAGAEKLAMDFLSDVWSPCEVCEGKRFTQEVLSVKYQGRSIWDILQTSAEDARELFKESSQITLAMDILISLGLSYLRLGQSTTTLSGGESQRLKLAAALLEAQKKDTKTLFLLDEPSAGLHGLDIALLQKSLRALVEEGHSVVMVEHDPELIAGSDWVIDLGPGGGPNGGKVIAEGAPMEIAENLESATGDVLRGVLGR